MSRSRVLALLACGLLACHDAPAEAPPTRGAAPPPPPAAEASADPSPTPASLALALGACAPDGTRAFREHGVTWLSSSGMAPLLGTNPPGDHFRYVCTGGQVARIERHDGTGALEAGDDGVAVEALEWRDEGATARLLDAAGQELSAAVARRNHSNTELLRVLQEWTDDVEEATTEDIHIRNGRVAERHFLTAEGAPMAAGPQHVYGVRYTYDASGGLTEEVYLGPDHEPAADARGVVHRRLRRSPQGFVVEESLHDAAGAPVADSTGTAAITLIVDHAGQVLETTRRSANGTPHAASDGVASTRYTLDPRGHVVREEYLDVGGRPAPGFRGIARIEQRYDAQGRLGERAQRDVQGRPVADGTGVATYGWRYVDGKANKRFFNAEGVETDRKGHPLTSGGAE